MIAPRSRRAAVSGAVLGWCAAQTPGALPRTTMLSATAGTVCAVVGLLIAVAASLLRSSRGPATGNGAACPVPLALTATAVLAGAVWWHTALRDAMGLPPIGPAWLFATVGVPLGVVAIILWVRISRALIVCTAALLAGATLGSGAFHGAAHAGPNVPDSPLLLYSRLDGRDPDARAADLTRAWVAEGGLDQRAVVIAVPTGSGWVDAAAVDGLNRRFGGSVRVLALQYSEVPSWQAFVRSPAAAGESAAVLLDAVTRAMRGAAHVPQIHLYGQSLGAVGADSARRWARANGIALAGTVLVGIPGGGRDSGDDPSRAVLNNPTDPVARLRVELLWKPPVPMPHRAHQLRAPAPPWLPGFSALASVIDLAGSLDVPSGFGHRYGVEQAGLPLPPRIATADPDITMAVP